MKILIILLFVFVTLHGSWTVVQAERVLRGEVHLVSPSGDTEPASLVSVILAGTGKATETDDLGQFIFDLPPHLTFGKPLNLGVQKKYKTKPGESGTLLAENCHCNGPYLLPLNSYLKGPKNSGQMNLSNITLRN